MSGRHRSSHGEGRSSGSRRHHHSDAVSSSRPASSPPPRDMTAPDHSRPRHGKVLTKPLTPPHSRDHRPRPRPGPSHRHRSPSPPRHQSFPRPRSPPRRSPRPSHRPSRRMSPHRAPGPPPPPPPPRRPSPPRYSHHHHRSPDPGPGHHSRDRHYDERPRHDRSHESGHRYERPEYENRRPDHRHAGTDGGRDHGRRSDGFNAEKTHRPRSERENKHHDSRNNVDYKERDRPVRDQERKSHSSSHHAHDRREDGSFTSDSGRASEVKRELSPRDMVSPSRKRSRSPVFEDQEQHDSIVRDYSPGDIPTVPRDQRTPPKILPPRPKHLRSPNTEQAPGPSSKKPKKSHDSRSSSHHTAKSERHEKDRKHKDGSSSSRSRHRDKAPEPMLAPPPPTISGDRRQSPHSSSRSYDYADYSSHEKDHRYKEPLLQEDCDMTASNTSTGVSKDWVVFRGPEEGEIDTKDLKRIQIDIRRNIPENKIKDGPVTRELGDPLRFVLPRHHSEGAVPLFSRDDVKPNAISEDKPEPDQKVRIKLDPLPEYELKLSEEISGDSRTSSNVKARWRERERERERSRSPRNDREFSLPLSDEWRVIDKDDNDDTEDRMDIRARLGERERSPKERRHARERLGMSVKDRLGEQLRDDDYRDHDTGGYRGHDYGGYRGGRGHFRGRRGRGYQSSYRGRGRKSDYGFRRSDDWKYDKYQEYEEPSSTTD